MLQFKLKYAFLTTYDFSMFLKQEKRKDGMVLLCPNLIMRGMRHQPKILHLFASPSSLDWRRALRTPGTPGMGHEIEPSCSKHNTSAQENRGL